MRGRRRLLRARRRGETGLSGQGGAGGGGSAPPPSADVLDEELTASESLQFSHSSLHAFDAISSTSLVLFALSGGIEGWGAGDETEDEEEERYQPGEMEGVEEVRQSEADLSGRAGERRQRGMASATGSSRAAAAGGAGAGGASLGREERAGRQTGAGNFARRINVRRKRRWRKRDLVRCAICGDRVVRGLGESLFGMDAHAATEAEVGSAYGNDTKGQEADGHAREWSDSEEHNLKDGHMGDTNLPHTGDTNLPPVRSGLGSGGAVCLFCGMVVHRACVLPAARDPCRKNPLVSDMKGGRGRKRRPAQRLLLMRDQSLKGNAASSDGDRGSGGGGGLSADGHGGRPDASASSALAPSKFSLVVLGGIIGGAMVAGPVGALGAGLFLEGGRVVTRAALSQQQQARRAAEEGILESDDGTDAFLQGLDDLYSELMGTESQADQENAEDAVDATPPPPPPPRRSDPVPHLYSVSQSRERQARLLRQTAQQQQEVGTLSAAAMATAIQGWREVAVRVMHEEKRKGSPMRFPLVDKLAADVGGMDIEDGAQAIVSQCFAQHDFLPEVLRRAIVDEFVQLHGNGGEADANATIVDMHTCLYLLERAVLLFYGHARDKLLEPIANARNHSVIAMVNSIDRFVFPDLYAVVFASIAASPEIQQLDDRLAAQLELQCAPFRGETTSANSAGGGGGGDDDDDSAFMDAETGPSPAEPGRAYLQQSSTGTDTSFVSAASVELTVDEATAVVSSSSLSTAPCGGGDNRGGGAPGAAFPELSARAVGFIRYIPQCVTAFDKLQIAVRSLEEIARSACGPGGTASGVSDMGGEELLRLTRLHLLAAAAATKPYPRWFAELRFIELFVRSDAWLLGREGYGYVTLYSALHQILEPAGDVADDVLAST